MAWYAPARYVTPNADEGRHRLEQDPYHGDVSAAQAKLFDWKINPYGPAAMINKVAWLADPEGTIVGHWKPAART
jgi:hypothetical protein